MQFVSFIEGLIAGLALATGFILGIRWSGKITHVANNIKSEGSIIYRTPKEEAEIESKFIEQN